MKIVDCKQGTEAWLAARAGIFTASEFDNLISPGKWEPRKGEMPNTYIHRKLAERVMGFPLQDGGSWATDQGSLLETEAIPWVAMNLGVNVERVGFVTTDDGRIGCSPDGLIGSDCGLEVKSPQPGTHLKYLLSGAVPTDYLAQVHGGMYVTGRPFWYFVSYSRQFPPLVLKVARDEKIIAAIDAALKAAMKEFDAKLARIVQLKAEFEAPLKAEYERKIAEWEKTGKIP